MKKILVIEDEPVIRASIIELLSYEDYITFEAENGLQGSQLAREMLPDLVLCDVMMPEMDGYGVLKSLRSDAATDTIPFVFLTALSDKTDLRQGMRLGADDYLTKPFTRDELLDAIKIRLDKHDNLTNRYTSELKQTKEKLESLVLYDSLTGLPNRLLLRQNFSNSMANTQSGPLNNNLIIPLLSLSVDRFHRISDSLGYSIGEQLLKAVALRLVACVGNVENVARLQASQFAILLPVTDHSHDASQLAQNILEALAQPFELDGQELFINTSIGVALWPFDGPDFDNLLKNADAALSRAKEMGGNNYQIYSPGMSVGFIEKITLETELRYALQRSEFKVFYQPVVSLPSGKIIGAEALIRWFHPEKGLIPPLKFIPVAEETNLIMPIGEWVLSTTCAQAKAWMSRGFPPIKVAVNISARQLTQADFCQKVARVLQETGLPPQYLELELTESILMQEVELAIQSLTNLKALGVHLAIDDFGTGYSSLSQLRRFPFDSLKIDQCFVRNMTENSGDTAITLAIIQMAQSLNLNLIAEGVETEAELTFLAQHACNEVQGYLFSRPVPVEEFEQMLISGKCLQMPAALTTC